MMCREGGLSIAMMAAGTLCVLTAGRAQATRLELSVKLSTMTQIAMVNMRFIHNVLHLRLGLQYSIIV